MIINFTQHDARPVLTGGWFAGIWLVVSLVVGTFIGCSAPQSRCVQTAAVGASHPITSTTARSKSTSNKSPVFTADPRFLSQYAATFRFRLGHPRSFTWLADGSRLFYLRSTSRSFVQRLYVFDPISGQETLLLTAEKLLAGAVETLSIEEKARRERQRQAGRGITSFRLSKDGNTLLVPLSGRIFLWHRRSKKITEVKLPGQGAVLDPRLSPDGKHVAWVRGGALWTQPLASRGRNRAVQLSPKSKTDISFGLAEFVAQEEMARQRGFWWSPDSRSLVFQRTDTRAVERMHIHDPLHPERPGRSWPYPRPGKTNATVTLGLVKITGGPVQWLDWDRKRWPYLTRVRWQKSAPLTIVVQNRLQTELVVLARTSSRTSSNTWHTLLTERDAAWLNLDRQMPRWLPGGQQFLWTTERNGAWQLELHRADGTLARTLTQKSLGYRRLVGLTKDGKELMLIAAQEPSEQHIFRLDLGPTTPQSQPKIMTHIPGWHSATMAEAGTAWTLHLNPKAGVRRVEVWRKGQKSGHNVRDEAENPGFKIKPRFFVVGPKQVRAAVLTPRGAKPGQRFPVILHVYGGPHYSMVRAAQSRWALQQWWADHGFVVVSLDGRGTPYRGRAWERVTKGDLLSAPLADQAEALRFVAKVVPAMDLQRVGVFGWSFGGTFSAAAVMRYPQLFKAAVAGAPVTDWLDYDTHYTERYLGLPSASNRAYKLSSPLHFAKSLKRPLMLIHGTADDNVWFSQSVKLAKLLFEAGVKHDFVPLPGHTHMVRDAKTLERMYERILGFFRRHL